jgi:hypothetical protein
MAWWTGSRAHPIATNRHFNFNTTDTRQPAVLFLFALFIFWGFGFETVGKRLYTRLDGTVISSRDVYKWQRRGTEYILRGPDAQAST